MAFCQKIDARLYRLFAESGGNSTNRLIGRFYRRRIVLRLRSRSFSAFSFNREAEGTGVVLRKGLRNIVASCQPCLEPALAVIN